MCYLYSDYNNLYTMHINLQLITYFGPLCLERPLLCLLGETQGRLFHLQAKTMCRNLIQYNATDAYQETNLLQFPHLYQRLTHLDEDSIGVAHDT